MSRDKFKVFNVFKKLKNIIFYSEVTLACFKAEAVRKYQAFCAYFRPLVLNFQSQKYRPQVQGVRNSASSEDRTTLALFCQ